MTLNDKPLTGVAVCETILHLLQYVRPLISSAKRKDKEKRGGGEHLEYFVQNNY